MTKNSTYLENFDENLPLSVVAEVSANHEGSLETAKKIIDLASRAGANAVKFQTYTPDSISLDSQEDDFLLPIGSPWERFGSFHNLYSKSNTPREWHKELFTHAQALGLVPFSSPFSESDVDFLETLDCPFYKLASPEINHLPLIWAIAKTDKPILISLGTASESQLIKAITEFRSISKAKIIVMQCESEYPASDTNSNLIILNALKQEYNLVVGFSDHTIGSKAAIIATALGAKVIEKHVTLNSGNHAIDGFFSADESFFSNYCKEIRKTEQILGNRVFRSSDESILNPKQRSIYPTRNLKVGHVVSEGDFRIVRPGWSLSPEFFGFISGKKLTRDIRKGERITLKDFH
jgi:pseudaminic acid synthase